MKFIVLCLWTSFIHKNIMKELKEELHRVVLQIIPSEISRWKHNRCSSVSCCIRGLETIRKC